MLWPGHSKRYKYERNLTKYRQGFQCTKNQINMCYITIIGNKIGKHTFTFKCEANLIVWWSNRFFKYPPYIMKCNVEAIIRDTRSTKLWHWIICLSFWNIWYFLYSSVLQFLGQKPLEVIMLLDWFLLFYHYIRTSADHIFLCI